MRNKIIFIAVVLVAICLGLLFNSQKSSPKLLSPILEKASLQKMTPSVTPTPTPIEFKFNRSTDLKKELDLVNPQVESSEFKALEEIIRSSF
jgi:hypothetical protein